MALKSTLKCSVCKEDKPREEIIKIGGKNYCQECAEEKQKPKDKSDWDILFEYINYLHGIDRPTGMMFKQLKDLRQDFGYTDIGVYYTLKYYHETLGNSVLEGSGLGIVPYYYDRAKKHYNSVFDLMDIAVGFEQDEKTIYTSVRQETKFKKRKPIDLGSIEWGDDDYED